MSELLTAVLMVCLPLLVSLIAYLARRREQLLSVRNPVVGQVWICMNNMKKYLVTYVETSTDGTVFVSMAQEYQNGPYGFGMGMDYATGIDQWRKRILKEEMHFLYMCPGYNEAHQGQ